MVMTTRASQHNLNYPAPSQSKLALAHLWLVKQDAISARVVPHELRQEAALRACGGLTIGKKFKSADC